MTSTMNYPSPDDIEDMKARGYDKSVIEEAIELSKRWRVKEELKTQITQAFSRTKLGAGIGLHEAQGIDDYASAETRAAYRESDEKDDWQALTVADLNKCYSSLSFFDAEGMRFHLPAFLLADLNGQFAHEVTYSLTSSSLRNDMFAMLNAVQRSAVRSYLQFIELEPEYEYERIDISNSLAGYWAE